MSLMDAMLLEGYRDPREVYIALRADGLKGSGTIDDPYDGSTISAPAVQITGLINTGVEATATTASNHGYIDGDVVQVSGVGGSGSAQWNGTFVVFWLSNTTFKYTMLAVPGGTASLSGSSLASKRVHRFDEVMRLYTQEDLLFRIGPGQFETRGNSPGNAGRGWRIQRGWKIRGAGIDVTVIKVVGVYVTTQLHYGIAIKDVYNDFADHAEVSDVTVDCNMNGNRNTGVAAVFLKGSHTLIRRVKAINWGTETDSAECFVLAIGGVHPDLMAYSTFTHGVIEDCICVEPHESNRRETTVIHSFGSDNPFDHRWAFSQCPILRRNFVDCGFSNGRSGFHLTIGSGKMSRTGAVAACDTSPRKHDKVVGQRFPVRNITPGSPQPSAGWFGYFEVTQVIDEFHFEFALNPAALPTETTFTGAALLGHGFSALSTGKCRGGLVEDNVVRNAWIGGPYQDTYNTREIIVRRNLYQNVSVAHYSNLGALTDGPKNIQSIQMVSATKAEVTISNHGFANTERINLRKVTPVEYNGVDLVVENASADKFQYVVVSSPAGSGSGGIVERKNAGLLGVEHLGSGVSEGTSFLGTAVGHQLQVGDRIKISNATVSSTDFTPNDAYNGFFEITAVSGNPQPNKFQFQANGIPSGAAFNATYQRVWGVDRLVVEENIVELRDAFGYEFGLPIGVSVLDSGLIDSSSGLPPFVHGEILIRRNVIRFVGGSLAAPFNGLGLFINGAKRLRVEENTVDLSEGAPLRHERCGEVFYFNNRTSAGKLIRGWGDGGAESVEDVQDVIEGAICL